MPNQIWQPCIQYYFKSFKERNDDDNSIEIIIKGNFVVTNIDKTSESEIFKRCTLLLVDKLQEILNHLSEKDDGTRVDVQPPPDFFR